jgi:hypothetical protein
VCNNKNESLYGKTMQELRFLDYGSGKDKEPYQWGALQN